MYKIMTAGPVQVRENVRLARSLQTTNPDIDESFVEEYKETCDKLGALVNSSGRTYILGGEGILGLEAACATLTEKGDRVLILDNGIFGKGFKDFAEMYGAETVMYTSDYTRPIYPSELRTFLENDSDFKYATLVHCDTPSGVLNPIEELCPLLAEFGIMTVVDSVAGMFGEKVDVDNWNIDILCGGSQKVLSAPPGLTMVWISDKAFDTMLSRNTPIASFYANLLTFKDYYEEKWFPYTMPISDIYGLRAAVDNIIADKDILERHSRIASALRNAVNEAGLSMYVSEGYSNTVTVINVPSGTTASDILKIMRDKYNVMISGSFDILSGKVIRIGHMGENATVADVHETLVALDGALAELGVVTKCSLAENFMENVQID